MVDVTFNYAAHASLPDCDAHSGADSLVLLPTRVLVVILLGSVSRCVDHFLLVVVPPSPEHPRPRPLLPIDDHGRCPAPHTRPAPALPHTFVRRRTWACLGVGPIRASGPRRPRACLGYRSIPSVACPWQAVRPGAPQQPTPSTPQGLPTRHGRSRGSLASVRRVVVVLVTLSSAGRPLRSRRHASWSSLPCRLGWRRSMWAATLLPCYRNLVSAACLPARCRGASQRAPLRHCDVSLSPYPARS